MMKHRRVVALVLLLSLGATLIGCFTIKVGGRAELAPSSDEGRKIAQRRCWYALFGMIPLGNNSTDGLIPANVKKVRVETKYTIAGMLLNILTA
jgi:hypothetical protein